LSTARRIRVTRGFTLLEVLVAVAILSLSLTSLLSSQMASMRATRYAEGVTAAAFLADYQLIEIQWVMKREGWITEDKMFEGDFDDLGWDDVRYECLVDFVELPEYGELIRAKDAAEDGATDAGLEPETYDATDQAFDAIGMVWPVVKAAIENAIRKASCTVYWTDGNIEHDFVVTTYWAEPERLTQIPELGGEMTEEDDESSDGTPEGSGGPGGGGRPGGARPGGARPKGGLRPSGGMGGPGGKGRGGRGG
jgi:type II secretion system protein I